MSLKKKTLILVGCIGAIMIALLIGFHVHSKRRIIHYVKQNQSDLLRIMEELQKDNVPEKTFYAKGFRWRAVRTNDERMIELYDLNGIWPWGYRGVYYSENDQPRAFQGVSQELVKQNNGWYWTDGTDNKGYTEKIIDRWFYFEASL